MQEISPNIMHHNRGLFHIFAARVSEIVGTPLAFGIAVLFIVFWILSGPVFGFSTGWQLVINTGTTIITFLIVFIIQNTQNRDSRAIHLKLDELIRATSRARNSLIDLEEMEDEDLDRFEKEFRKVYERALSKRKLLSQSSKHE